MSDTKMPLSSPPTGPLSDHIDRILALDDRPALRNLLITQAYHDLSEGMGRLIGRENISWTTMASWSSRSVGGLLRNDRIAELLRRLLEGSEVWRSATERIDAELGRLDPRSDTTSCPSHGDILLATATRILRDVRTYLSRGNAMVFAEIGSAFARFIRAFDSSESRDGDELARFLASFRPGPVRPDEVAIDPESGMVTSEQRGGQGLLASAMTHYHRAMFTGDRRDRAELVLLANAEVSLHEQTRLQRYIAGSLDAPIGDGFHDDSHDALAERIADPHTRGLAHAALDRLLPALSEHIAGIWREFSTVALTTLTLPDRVLRLGEDLVAAPGQPLYPEVLTVIANPDLRAMLEQYGALHGSGALAGDAAGHGAGQPRAGLGAIVRLVRLVRLDPIVRVVDTVKRGVQELFGDAGLAQRVVIGAADRDWTSLSRRMAFILPLFRSRQQDGDLFEQPFTAEQREAILHGRIPDGPLA